MNICVIVFIFIIIHHMYICFVEYDHILVSIVSSHVFKVSNKQQERIICIY